MKKIIMVFALVTLLTACENNAEKTKTDSFGIEAKEEPREQNSTPEYEMNIDSTIIPSLNKDSKQKQPQGIVKKEPDWDKKIIRTASLEIEVKDFGKYAAALREKIRAYGGYIANENQEQSNYKIQNSIVIKVPVDQFEDAVNALNTVTDKLVAKNISSQDVSGEFIDTRSRMEARKQVRLRYLDLLKQAKNMEEILHVQSEINSIQEEIEAANGRISYLGHAARFSTISLVYYQVLDAGAKEDEEPSFGSRFATAFSSGWSSVVSFIVGLVYLWPLLILIAALLIVVKRTKLLKSGKAV